MEPTQAFPKESIAVALGRPGRVFFLGELPFLAPGLWIGLELFQPHNLPYPLVEFAPASASPVNNDREHIREDTQHKKNPLSNFLPRIKQSNPRTITARGKSGQAKTSPSPPKTSRLSHIAPLPASAAPASLSRVSSTDSLESLNPMSTSEPMHDFASASTLAHLFKLIRGDPARTYFAPFQFASRPGIGHSELASASSEAYHRNQGPKHQYFAPYHARIATALVHSPSTRTLPQHYACLQASSKRPYISASPAQVAEHETAHSPALTGEIVTVPSHELGAKLLEGASSWEGTASISSADHALLNTLAQMMAVPPSSNLAASLPMAEFYDKFGMAPLSLFVFRRTLAREAVETHRRRVVFGASNVLMHVLSALQGNDALSCLVNKAQPKPNVMADAGLLAEAEALAVATERAVGLGAGSPHSKQATRAALRQLDAQTKLYLNSDAMTAQERRWFPLQGSATASMSCLSRPSAPSKSSAIPERHFSLNELGRIQELQDTARRLNLEGPSALVDAIAITAPPSARTSLPRLAEHLLQNDFVFASDAARVRVFARFVCEALVLTRSVKHKWVQAVDTHPRQPGSGSEAAAASPSPSPGASQPAPAAAFAEPLMCCSECGLEMSQPLWARLFARGADRVQRVSPHPRYALAVGCECPCSARCGCGVPLEQLRKGYTTRFGAAALFSCLAAAAGFSVVTLTGLAKVRDRNAGWALAPLAHHWNAVWLPTDKRWCLVDCALAMGFLCSEPITRPTIELSHRPQYHHTSDGFAESDFVKSFCPAYIDADPDFFARDHFPLAAVDVSACYAATTRAEVLSALQLPPQRHPFLEVAQRTQALLRDGPSPLLNVYSRQAFLRTPFPGRRRAEFGVRLVPDTRALHAPHGFFSLELEATREVDYWVDIRAKPAPIAAQETQVSLVPSVAELLLPDPALLRSGQPQPLADIDPALLALPREEDEAASPLPSASAQSEPEAQPRLQMSGSMLLRQMMQSASRSGLAAEPRRDADLTHTPTDSPRAVSRAATAAPSAPSPPSPRPALWQPKASKPVSRSFKATQKRTLMAARAPPPTQGESLAALPAEHFAQGFRFAVALLARDFPLDPLKSADAAKEDDEDSEAAADWAGPRSGLPPRALLSKCWHVMHLPQQRAEPGETQIYRSRVFGVLPRSGEVLVSISARLPDQKPTLWQDIDVQGKETNRVSVGYTAIADFHVTTERGLYDTPHVDFARIHCGFLQQVPAVEPRLAALARSFVLLEPLTGMWLVPGVTEVRILAPPEAEQAIAVCNGHWMHLTRAHGQGALAGFVTFAGRVPITAPDVVVYYRFFGRFHLLYTFVTRSCAMDYVSERTRALRETSSKRRHSNAAAWEDDMKLQRKSFVQLAALETRRGLEGLFGEERDKVDPGAMVLQRPFASAVQLNVSGKAFDCEIHLDYIESSAGRLRMLVHAMTHVNFKPQLRAGWAPHRAMRAPHRLHVREMSVPDVEHKLGVVITNEDKQRLKWWLVTVLFPNDVELQAEQAKSDAVTPVVGLSSVLSAQQFEFSQRSKFTVLMNFTDRDVPGAEQFFAFSHTCFLPMHKARRLVLIGQVPR